MVEVDGTGGYSKTSLWFTWMSAFFAMGAGAVIMCVVAGEVQRSRGTASDHGHAPPGRRSSAGANAKRGFLTSNQVRELFSTCDSMLRGKDDEAKEWTCSICLEENEPSEDVRTVLLPCSHRFHRQYVLGVDNFTAVWTHWVNSNIAGNSSYQN
jgi:RING-like zinc finger